MITDSLRTPSYGSFHCPFEKYNNSGLALFVLYCEEEKKEGATYLAENLKHSVIKVILILKYWTT